MKNSFYLWIIICALIFISACRNASKNQISNDIIKTSILCENINPSNKYKAIFYSKIGAVPNAVTFHLSILPVANNLNESKDGNVLNAILEPEDEMKYDLLSINWESNTQLEVFLKKDMKLLQNKNYFVNGKDTISIKYIP